MTAFDPPLAGLRIIDAVTGPMAPITRYLADLGARVERIVPTDMTGATDLAANRGKIVAGRAPSDLAGVHAVVSDASGTLDLAALRLADPALVTMTVSDFGTDTAFASWKGSGKVLHALSGVLSRSGLRGREPLMPPATLAHECACVQAAFLLAAALHRALATGQGGHFDFSALEGAAQALDPGFGINGSATLGRPIGLLSRDRPAAGFQYPIFPCADGHVRICLLSKRQWRGMFEWMGRPERFASPEFDKTAHRYKSPDLLPHVAAFLSGRRRADLEREGQAHGVPISGLNTLGEFLESPHLAARDAFCEWPGGDGRTVRLPGAMQTIDGQRGSPQMAGDGTPLAFRAAPPRAGAARMPFAGLRVLDLGIIVVGAEQGRLLADMGADVVKVESRAFPDGNRQSYLDFGMSVSFAAGHRNKRSLGIDLRSDDGRALFLDLVAQADVLCANFKPGTLDKLGLGQDVLFAANPRLVISQSSAFGDSGPWQDRMGYGPLVRAATGLTFAWRYPDDPEGFCDAVTVYPDHAAGRVCALGAVALLIRRLRTGKGGASAVAQSEVMLGHFAADVARLTGGLPEDAAARGPSGVFPCAGEDEWCVVDVRDEAECAALQALVGAEPDLAGAVAAWLAARSPFEAARLLQEAGVPAAPMLRIADLPGFEYFAARGFYRLERHPWLREAVTGECSTARGDTLPPPPTGAAPLSGEQSAEVVRDWLGLGDAAIAALCEAGVLEPLDPRIRASAEAHVAQPALRH